MESPGETPHNSGTPSRKQIVSIAAGEAHTLALSGDGKLYSWGRGTFGRLGTGSVSDHLFPVPVHFDYSHELGRGHRLRFVAVAAGAYHSLALADDGSLWCWGSNTYGQLSTSDEKSLVPHLVEQFLDLGSHDTSTGSVQTDAKTQLKIHAIKAGGMMSLAVDNLGTLWMWGNCPQQSSISDGKFSLAATSTPFPIWHFHGRMVVKVACGNEHVVALVSAAETYEGGELLCYSWGNNNHGQLGLGDAESRLNPEVVHTFDLESVWGVDEVACGAFHTAVLSHRRRPSDVLESVCWTFGLGENGQLGHGTTRSSLLPEIVVGLPEHVFLISVDCGLFHTSLVTSAGEVWSWGMEKGLGLCPDASFTGNDAGDAISPRLYGPKFPRPVQVACGAAHTLVVASDGCRLWCWGRGRSGVLGNGKTVDCFTPSIALWPPLEQDFNEEELQTSAGKGKAEDVGTTEMERKLSMAMEELTLVQSKLSVMERYASILHGSIFGKAFDEQDIPVSLRSLGTFDVAQEWENLLESADCGKLIRLEAFYRSMLAGVKDKLMKQRIREIVRECLRS